MTGSNDLDRMLAAYLDDGPRRAPDRATDAAIAFAAAHPRRRDPLLFLKPDVMARRGALIGPQLAWAALLIGLTLGAVAAIAVGTRPSPEPVVPAPSIVTPPSPSPSNAPSPTEFAIELFDPSNEIRTPIAAVQIHVENALRAGTRFSTLRPQQERSEEVHTKLCLIRSLRSPASG